MKTVFVLVLCFPACHWCTTKEPVEQLKVFKDMMREVGLEKFYPTIEESVMKKMTMAQIDDFDLLSKVRCIHSEVKKISELMKLDTTTIPENIDKLVRMILQYLRPQMNNLQFSNDTLKDVFDMTEEKINEYHQLCKESRDLFFQLDFKFNKEMQ